MKRNQSFYRIILSLSWIISVDSMANEVPRLPAPEKSDRNLTQESVQENTIFSPVYEIKYDSNHQQNLSQFDHGKVFPQLGNSNPTGERVGPAIQQGLFYPGTQQFVDEATLNRMILLNMMEKSRNSPNPGPR
jgi:hypothetical protein